MKQGTIKVLSEMNLLAGEEVEKLSKEVRDGLRMTFLRFLRAGGRIDLGEYLSLDMPVQEELERAGLERDRELIGRFLELTTKLSEEETDRILGEMGDKESPIAQVIEKSAREALKSAL